MSAVAVGTHVLASHLLGGPWSGVGVVTEVGRRFGLAGAWVMPAGAGGGPPWFVTDIHLTAAVVGVTVCVKSRGECYCRLAHVTGVALAALPRRTRATETPEERSMRRRASGWGPADSAEDNSYGGVV